MNQTKAVSKVLPRRVCVDKLLSGRYAAGERPTSWDDRIAGTEKVSTTEGEEILLMSRGGQSTPESGWELLLMKESSEFPEALEWTVYGICKS